MVIRELLRKAAEILKDKGIEDSFNEAAVLLAFALGKSKTYCFTHMDESVDSDTMKRFDDFIIKRSCRMPVAYITSSSWFMSLEFDVNESTLIPRPETEGLVEEVLCHIKNSNDNEIKILDLCTGSGCVGISIAFYAKKAVVTLSDINPECIMISCENIRKHNLSDRVSAIESDLFKSLGNIKFNYIIANPPYIPSKEIADLENDVRLYEPLIALDGGVDGLDFYRKIATEIKTHLKSGGSLFIEIGINQRDAVVEIFRENGFSDIEVKTDINGIPRIITICQNSHPLF